MKIFVVLASLMVLVLVEFGHVEARINMACRQPKEIGRCRAAMPRYFFNTATGKCELFLYGGCEGNGNNFVRRRECQNSCAVRRGDVCSLPPDIGPCKAAFTKYYYDTATQKCKSFIYGGCEGNGNNFSTRRECKKSCMGR